jgi:hypothetical protein
MKSALSWVGLVLLAGWALLSLVMAIWNTFTPLGGNDLYTYWYAGLFIRQGDDLMPPLLPVSSLICPSPSWMVKRIRSMR